ncbi:MAG: sugar nucleotide-binding protein [Deltaproteobacteria bacterium]|nr:sugar nucleotide-binding protein [Deltaproteobacteria bacterium]
MILSGASKLAGDAAVRRLSPRHLILRVSWVFGAHGRMGARLCELGVIEPRAHRGAVVDERIFMPWPLLRVTSFGRPASPRRRGSRNRVRR